MLFYYLKITLMVSVASAMMSDDIGQSHSEGYMELLNTIPEMGLVDIQTQLFEVVPGAEWSARARGCVREAIASRIDELFKAAKKKRDDNPKDSEAERKVCHLHALNF